MTDLVVTLTVLSCGILGILRATATRSSSDARRRGMTSIIGQRSPIAALLFPNLIHHFPRSLGMLEKVLHIPSKEIAPSPNRSVGDDGDVAKHNQNTEDRLLKSSYFAQIYRVQTCVSHGTCTEEEGVDEAECENSLGIATIAIDAAAIHYAR